MSFYEILAVIGIDILLSGDNAIIIALAVRKLPPHLQKKVIFWGMLGAILLRILAATLIISIFHYPLIKAIAGIVLIVIAYQMMVQKDETHNIKSSNHFFGAIRIIAISDLALSIDNVIALTSVSNDIMPIITGIIISIPIIIFGSQFLLKLMDKFKIIIYIGSGLLVFAAAKMIIGDKGMEFIANAIPDSYHIGLSIIIAMLTVLFGFIRNKIKGISISL
ncbi:YjbE family putative metal transport protein [Bacillus sp. B1-b2]|uniref:YjbE family putative metal transport protein n=1 Tax=Bacillus sp. B1-b2 TaxID=2653201 RepID=UPI001261C728|nr:YjbE family putative metal transport protein [Bacillus sp. B1-b2]KAB7667160.1 YjbE family putative metal transport protein [Bacillus sp. B1-b2]